ncbi:thiamine biosynthesis protein ThiF [Sphingobacterium sp. ML3W]|uniref:HesA/MoeB/ThiF family protein n=1 Tax=Sphingobacterium TaxID=28453 RepID=UPI0004F6FAC1|nr:MULTISPECIES: HesA/MoeB/ThiF family protein [Sphingobacterium]AIM36360.1 thiamine biosynthesis protein ThiF [Sphingobacterium sp. ML3W]MDH5827501.1 HesA/MoeB/ThiF family protein [Sphingobacterium faecium]
MQPHDAFDRYSRQIFINEIGIEGQQKIMAAKVLVIGAGGLGSPVLQYLAAAGVGNLGIIDFDHVEIHNLNRQIIHNEKRVQQEKVYSASTFIQELNSSVNIDCLFIKINIENAESIIQDYDIVVDGSDNFNTRYIVNDACVRTNKVLVYGSIFAFEGQMAVFNYKGSKQLRDLYPEAPRPEDAPTCEQYGVLGPLPGIIGSMMAMQVLKIITELPVDSNKLTLVDAYHWRFNTISF